MLTPSEKSKMALLRFEGLDQPSKWPGLNSGITIGYGYDLGYKTEKQFVKDWVGLPIDWIERLSRVIGVTGIEAKRLAPQFKDINISKDLAIKVFDKIYPGWCKDTLKCYPGLDSLHPHAQGALVSMIYHRGSTIDPNKEDHLEKFALKAAVANQDYTQIAALLRGMKRLCSLKYIQDRREAEALLVEEGLKEILAD